MTTTYRNLLSTPDYSESSAQFNTEITFDDGLIINDSAKLPFLTVSSPVFTNSTGYLTSTASSSVSLNGLVASSIRNSGLTSASGSIVFADLSGNLTLTSPTTANLAGTTTLKIENATDSKFFSLGSSTVYGNLLHVISTGTTRLLSFDTANPTNFPLIDVVKSGTTGTVVLSANTGVYAYTDSFRVKAYGGTDRLVIDTSANAITTLPTFSSNIVPTASGYTLGVSGNPFATVWATNWNGSTIVNRVFCNAGSSNSPGVQFTGSNGSGIYFVSPILGISVNGVTIATYGGTEILPGSHNTISLGNNATRFSKIYSAQIVDNGSDLAVGKFSSNVSPSTTNSIYCGVASFGWQGVKSYAYETLSDQRLKTDIENEDLGLSFIMALTARKYKFIVGKNQVTEATYDQSGNELTARTVTAVPGTRIHHGLIAQELKTALESQGKTINDFSGLRMEDPNDSNSLYTVEYTQIITPMIKAIQELNALVTALTARVEALES